jgi:hypothetical protein
MVFDKGKRNKKNIKIKTYNHNKKKRIKILFINETD